MVPVCSRKEFRGWVSSPCFCSAAASVGLRRLRAALSTETSFDLKISLLGLR